jgi:hypothetical protein
MVVHACEPEVLERAVAQKLKDPDLRSLRRERTRVDLLEDGPELHSGHRDKSLRRVDFQLCWLIEFSIGPCDGFIFL